MIRRSKVIAGHGGGVGVRASVSDPDFAPEAEQQVEMTLSTDLAGQTIRYGERRWSQRRELLMLDQHDAVRVVVLNDTPGPRTLTFLGEIFAGAEPVALAPGAAAVFDVQAEVCGEGFIRLDNGVERTVEVRPAYCLGKPE